MGRTAILLLSPGQIVPLLKDPSLRKAAWIGPQGLLARLDPSLELDLLARFGAGTEDRDVNLLLRLVDVGGAGEERTVAAAGFRVVAQGRPELDRHRPDVGTPETAGKRSNHLYRKSVLNGKPSEGAIPIDPRLPKGFPAGFDRRPGAFTGRGARMLQPVLRNEGESGAGG